MKRLWHIFFLLLFLFTPCLSLMAQTANRPGQPAGKSQQDEARERIETLRMWRLTKALDLDEKGCALVFPILSRYDRRRTEVQRALGAGMGDLRKAIAMADKPEAVLRKIIDGLERNRKVLQDINQEEWTTLRGVLTVEQQAKYLIFQQEFNQQISKMIENAKEKNLGK